MSVQYLKKVSNIAVLILWTFLLTGCQVDSIETYSDNMIELERPFLVTRFDKEIQWQDGIEIELTDKSEECVITNGGNYKLTGQTSEGIRIDAEDQNVHLFLDGVTIDTNAGPAIWVRSAGKVVITIMEETNNILSDYPSQEDSKNADAALFCECDLTLNGSGFLEISGYHKNAIYSKDVLKILGGDIVIRAKNDGIRGSDGIVLSPNNLLVQSEQTGIRTSNTGKAGKGSVDICGGYIDIIAGEYGIKAVADLYVDGANVTCQGVIDDILVEGQEYITDDCVK